jgi:hypothetical protein
MKLATINSQTNPSVKNRTSILSCEYTYTLVLSLLYFYIHIGNVILWQWMCIQ